MEKLIAGVAVATKKNKTENLDGDKLVSVPNLCRKASIQSSDWKKGKKNPQSLHKNAVLASCSARRSINLPVMIQLQLSVSDCGFMVSVTHV